MYMYYTFFELSLYYSFISSFPYLSTFWTPTNLLFFRPHNENLLEVVVAHGRDRVAAPDLVARLRHDHVARLGHVPAEGGQDGEAEDEGIAVLDAVLQPTNQPTNQESQEPTNIKNAKNWKFILKRFFQVAGPVLEPLWRTPSPCTCQPIHSLKGWLVQSAELDTFFEIPKTEKSNIHQKKHLLFGLLLGEETLWLTLLNQNTSFT